eukprot:scaffold191794_cov17-Prasinocladus_malaysianus.AAC.1
MLTTSTRYTRSVDSALKRQDGLSSFCGHCQRSSDLISIDHLPPLGATRSLDCASKDCKA